MISRLSVGWQEIQILRRNTPEQVPLLLTNRFCVTDHLAVSEVCEIISTVFDFKGVLIIPLKAQSYEL